MFRGTVLVWQVQSVTANILPVDSVAGENIYNKVHNTEACLLSTLRLMFFPSSASLHRFLFAIECLVQSSERPLSCLFVPAGMADLSCQVLDADVCKKDFLWQSRRLSRSPVWRWQLPDSAVMWCAGISQTTSILTKTNYFKWAYVYLVTEPNLIWILMETERSPIATEGITFLAKGQWDFSTGFCITAE